VNILIVFSQPWAVGGAETHVTDLVKGLVQRGNKVFLAVHANESPQLRGIVQEQFVLNFRSKDPFDYIALGKQIASIVEKNNIDVLHAHQRTSGYIAAYVKYLTQVPFLVTIHDPWNRAYAKKLHAKIYDNIITVSEFLRQRFIHDFGFNSSMVHTVYNGANQDTYNPSRFSCEQISEWKNNFNIKENDKVISLIARLYRSKGQQYLIAAAPEILKTVPEVKFLLAGDGPHEELLKKQAQDLGVLDSFIFAGYRQDIPEIIALSDIVVRPSEMEGLPINVIEAMLMAKPVVATNIAGVPEMLDHGVNGYMIEVGDVTSLSQILIEALLDEDKCKAIGNAARKTAFEKFTIDACVEKTMALYVDVARQS
jgi:glycosyltransferase involved in cell wall biosynthesis